MKNKDTKERLFEVMSKIDPTFKMNLNEAADTQTNQVINDVKNDLGIDDWDSPDGINKRKQAAYTVFDYITKIKELMKKGASNTELGRIINKMLQIGWLGAAIKGVLSFIDGIKKYGVGDAAGDIVTHGYNKALSFFHLGGGAHTEIGNIVNNTEFWMHVAIILLALQILHSILIKGGRMWGDLKYFFNGIGKIFNWIRGKNKNNTQNKEENVQEIVSNLNNYLNETYTINVSNNKIIL